MKQKYILVLALILFCGQADALYSTHSFSFGGVTRQYRLYVPAMYDGTQSVPLVIALHGLGDNISGFSTAINMNAVADTANFIFVVPQLLIDAVYTGSTAWNSGAGFGGYTLNPDVDDIGFLNALMDTVSANYNIDQSRIYATGFSMGGFMCNRLACELNNRVAAIASVSGTIGNGITCQPDRAVPVAHFHGTADSTIRYTGNFYGNDPEDLVKFWIHHNTCDSTAIIDSLPDIKSDGKTVIHYKYPNGRYSTEVEFFKVVGGIHDWLTSANDINYSVEIWRFFSRFQWTPQTSGILNRRINSSISVFPNPAQNEMIIGIEDFTDPVRHIMITDLAGRKVWEQAGVENSAMYKINASCLANGVYFAIINCGVYKISKKIVVSR